MTGQEFAQKWAAKLGAATTDYKKGVQAVTESPTAKAANAQDKMVAGVQRAVANGKFAAACRRVSTEQWKDATIKKGVERLAGGANAAIPKMASFADEFLPAQQAITAQVNSMPNDTREARMAKAMAMMQKMAEWGDRRRGG